MRTILLLFVYCLLTISGFSQKKPLDASVYDGWQSVGERLLSPDGKWLVYIVVPQEGDTRLFIRGVESNYAKEIPRGVNASITADSRFLVFQIRPLFKDLREARIKKRTPDQSPKDTLAWIELGHDSLTRIPRVKSYKIAEKAGDWLACLMDKPDSGRAGGNGGKPADSLTRIRQLLARADSLSRVADSIRLKVAEIGTRGFAALPPVKPRPSAGETIEEGTPLVLINLQTREEKRFSLASEYYFSKQGNVFVLETTRRNADSNSRAMVLWVTTASGKVDTVLKGFHDACNYALDESGSQLAFAAERDSVAKALRKFYHLWYYRPGQDTAVKLPDGVAAKANLTISPDYANHFSRDGGRLFAGFAPIRPPKDTTLVDFETARLDVWNYKDDYLSPQQLVQLKDELKRSYLAVYSPGPSPHELVPTLLADEDCETIALPHDGIGPYALGLSSKGYRIQQQWEESNLRKIYLVDLKTGGRRLVQDRVRGNATLSPGGQYISWYDWKKRSWFTYRVEDGSVHNITAGIRVPLYDEEDDHPDDPPPHGVMGWQEGDRSVYIYDRYDIWKCDPGGSAAPVNITKGV
ncbi:MAG TPA: hypothetical protein VNU72_11650, partial [Puia sp.]|nr:hypothetical protein [Puia sp.]